MYNIFSIDERVSIRLHLVGQVCTLLKHLFITQDWVEDFELFSALYYKSDWIFLNT